MTDPSPELERIVEESYSRLEPKRVFRGCKVAEDESGIVVRIYSQSREHPPMWPTPFRIFRFDSATGALKALPAEEAARYKIENYK